MRNTHQTSRSPAWDNILHGLSHIVIGAPARSISFLLVVLLLTGITWAAKYYLEQTEKNGSIIVDLKPPENEQITIELDGYKSIESKTGKVRFEDVRPGKHFIAIYLNDQQPLIGEINVRGGQELNICQKDLGLFEVSDAGESSNESVSTERATQMFDVIIDAANGGEDPGDGCQDRCRIS